MSSKGADMQRLWWIEPPCQGLPQVRKSIHQGAEGKKRTMKQETEGTESSDGDQDKSYGKVNTIHIRAVKGCAARLEAEINDVRVKMLYDPGAARSVICEQTWRKVGAPPLKLTDTLIAYTNVPVEETLGETEVRVRAFGRVKCLLVSVLKEQDKLFLA